MLPDEKSCCPVCQQAFTEQEDVVVCPLCGAPHHRSCYRETGHCYYENTHGTDKQWTPKANRHDADARVCQNCGTANVPDARQCSKCGRSFDEEEEGVPFAAPSHTHNEDQERLMDIVTFVGPHSPYYISRFQAMDTQSTHMSWNWAAAFFPLEWLLYRKMFKQFFSALAIAFLLILPSIVATVISYRAMFADPAALQQFLETMQLPMEALPSWLSQVLNYASVLILMFRGVLALQANALYRRHVLKSIADVRKNCQDPLYYRYTLSKQGGTGAKYVLIFYAALVLVFIAGSLWLAAMTV